MSNSVNDELAEAIAELRALFPDWRMGQLMANLVMAAGDIDGSAIWDIEDDRLLVAARRLIDRNRGRLANSAESGAVLEPGSATVSRDRRDYEEKP